jgi:ATPase family protein associated with various cellular activities (AAA)/winged helix domain-containing protein
MKAVDAAAWDAANAKYLTEGIAWIRTRLERVASQRTDAVKPRAVRGPRRAAAAAQTEHAPLTMKIDPPPALVLLAGLFGLSPFEQDLLLLCVAMELDTRVAALCAAAHDDPQRRFPTFALALSAFDDAAWDALSPGRPLRYWRLIEIVDRGLTPLTVAPLHANERIVNYVKGLNHLDERVSELLEPVAAPTDEGDLPPSHQRVAETIFGSWKREPASGPPVVQLVGADRPSAMRIAAEVANAIGRRLYRLPAENVPRSVSEVESFARLWRRESILLPVALWLDAHEADVSGDASPLATVRRFLARGAGYVFLAAREPWPSVAPDVITLDVRKPTAVEQRTLWTSLLGAKEKAAPAMLASQFDLDATAIVRIATDEVAKRGGEPLGVRLWDACVASARPTLDALAQRLEPKVTWDDLVLPDAELELLRQIADQVAARYAVYETWGFAKRMNRGFGISALFAGDSGLGKTMSAEVLANALRLSLYRIDLSAVVNKYIGETEKNLRKLFDAAEDGGAILFFDEADALFGKRSEVRDSHDRYANIETNYLLQRMEAFRGLAILATNMKGSLDPAFMRRLRFIVNFPHPGIAERKRMWERAFPAAALGEPLDVARLARLNLTGAVIHAAALNAAFLAVRDGSKVTMAHVLAAVRQELLKADRPINEADFILPAKQGAA